MTAHVTATGFAPDVIVAGAGPVGLVAALTLAQAGIRTLLLDKRPGLGTASLASTIHPPTLEILHRLGVLDACLPLGQRVDTIQYRSPDGIFATFRMDSLQGITPFPFRLHLEQARITPLLLHRLRALPNARILFGAELAALHTTGTGVRIHLTGGVTHHAPHLLAADGARSTVRQALGIPFDGVDYPDRILRLVTRDELDPILPGIAPLTYLFRFPHSASFLRMADCWRIILRVPAETPDAEALHPDWMLPRLQAVLPHCPRLPTIAHADVYGASRRIAATFTHGRTHLIGDAAHVTNTRGGMNMNCGIYDAVHLATAIATSADPAAAAAERRRVAVEQLIPRTDRAVAGGPAWTDALRQKAQDPEAARAYLETAAMLDMTGPGHPA